MNSATKSDLHTIGEASRLSGLPVKTIRFYSDEGLLPPSGTTEAGYRLYSERDLLRLDLIRTLRAVGFDLPTIRAMLEGREGPTDAARLQLEALDVQIRGLKRQRALLRTALERRGGEDLLAYLKQAHALARLNAMEREGFVREHMVRGLSEVPVAANWLDGLLKAAVADLPEETDEVAVRILRATVEVGHIGVDRLGVVEAAFAYTNCCGQAILTSPGPTTLLERQYVSGDFFSALGIRPLHGRLLTAADDRRGAVLGGPYRQPDRLPA